MPFVYSVNRQCFKILKSFTTWLIEANRNSSHFNFEFSALGGVVDQVLDSNRRYNNGVLVKLPIKIKYYV